MTRRATHCGSTVLSDRLRPAIRARAVVAPERHRTHRPGYPVGAP